MYHSVFTEFATTYPFFLPIHVHVCLVNIYLTYVSYVKMGPIYMHWIIQMVLFLAWLCFRVIGRWNVCAHTFVSEQMMGNYSFPMLVCVLD